MQKASELVPSGMLSVIGRPQALYKQACVQAKEHCANQGIEEPVCSVANYLFPDGRVIAGHQKVETLSSLRVWTQNLVTPASPYLCFLSRLWISSSRTREDSSF